MSIFFDDEEQPAPPSVPTAEEIDAAHYTLERAGFVTYLYNPVEIMTELGFDLAPDEARHVVEKGLDWSGGIGSDDSFLIAVEALYPSATRAVDDEDDNDHDDIDEEAGA